MVRGSTEWTKLTLIVALGSLLLLGACGNDDDDDDGGPGPAPTATQPAQPTATTDPGVPTPTEDPNETPVPTATEGPGSPALTTVESFAAGLAPSLAELGQSFSQTGDTTARGITLPPTTVPCTGGGNLSIACSAEGAGSATTITGNDCTNPDGEGGTTTIDGTIVQRVDTACFVPLPANATFEIDFDVTIVDNPASGGSTTSSVDAVMDFTLDGSGGVTFAIDGEVTSDCLGTSETVTISTPTTVRQPAGSDCPVEGEFLLGFQGDSHRVTFTSGGGFEIDLGDDGSVDESFASCLDADEGECG